MLFSSFEFLFLFLPLCIGAVGLTQGLGRTVSLAVILLFSLFFYSYFYLPYLFLIGASILINYHAGEYVKRHHDHRALMLVVAVNVALLVAFKYTDMLIATLNWSLPLDIPETGLLLPLAISFFTFQQIAYLVDSSKGTTYRNSLLEYSVFIAFFPQLIAGPIVRQQHVMRALHTQGVRVGLDRLGVGLTIVLLGLAKKVIFADQFAEIADPIFDANTAGLIPSRIDAWIALLAYALQIYFDFSAYSDMAIGVGIVFGLRLPINFYSPYKARSIVDFWHRWHISLSTFLRDYLYFPLGGNRRGPVRRYGNLITVMLIGGLWHGADWAFMLWGAIHGSYLAINHAVSAGLKRHRSKTLTGAAEFFGPVVTFAAVLLAWVPFRANGLSWIDYYQALFAGAGGTSLGAHIPFVLFGLTVVWLLPNLMQVFGYEDQAPERLQVDQHPTRLRWQPTWGWAVLASAVLVCSLMTLLATPPNTFIYFQF